MRRSIAIAAVLTVAGGLAVGSVGPASAANATVITLCRDSQLRDAIAAVPAGGTILFGCDGTIRLDPNKGEIEIHKELTLDANGHAVSISGDHRSQIFIISLRGTVTMRGLTLKDANPAESPGGGAVFVGGARFVSDHMRFVNNQAGNLENGGNGLAGGGGGAISVLGTSGALVVTDSEFVGNSALCGLFCRAGGGGGAISLRNGGPSLIRRSVFQNNRETGGDGGGAIAATFVSRPSAFYLNGAVTIEFSTFVNNTSNTVSGEHGVVGGGAVVSLSHPLAIANSLFTANTADVNLGPLGSGVQAAGGAVRSGRSRDPDTPGFPTSITDSIFTANAARGRASEGGAVLVDDQPVQISRSTLNGNQADQGSALRIGGDATTITDSRLSGNVNTSDLEVGAVWMAGRTTFAGTRLVNNTSGCYFAVFGDKVGSVVDKGNNIETPGHSCGFRPAGPPTP